MLNNLKFICLCCIIFTFPIVAIAQSKDDIATRIILENCIDCHSGSKPKGGLDLTTRDKLLIGGDNGPGLGENNKNGQLLEVLKDGRMPPKKPLDKTSTMHLINWIASGARYPTPKIDALNTTTSKRAGKDWWSFQPLQIKPVQINHDSLPGMEPLDHFIAQGLNQKGLKPNGLAEKRTLIRRISHDLTGLPPTPSEVEDFIADKSPTAYVKLVDRLLSSPAYGEKWARHWLDIVRYGESDGFERNAPRANAWYYRDWIIKALNNDMPYDQFVKMQIAGDSIFPGDSDSIFALGFLVAGIHNTVLGSNAEAREQARQDEMEDLVGSIGQTFLGLTINCARCHDHKFDPISQHDYYQMTANLSGVRQGNKSIPNIKVAQEIEKAGKEKSFLEKELNEIEKIALQKISSGTGQVVSRPIAEWDFRKGLSDIQKNLTLKLEGGAILTPSGLEFNGKTSVARSSKLSIGLREKTLEAVVLLKNLEQKGGGVITVETTSGNLFDSIVFAELEPAKWMAGSNFHHRTQSFKGLTEKEAQLKPIHIAITYSDDGKVTAYRNGEIYGSTYQSKGIAEFPANDTIIAMGIRHEPPGGNHSLACTIVKARVFDKSLKPEEIKTLHKESEVFVSENQIISNLSSDFQKKRQSIIESISSIESRLKELTTKKDDRTVYSAISSTPLPTRFLNRGQVSDPGDQVSPGFINTLTFPGNIPPANPNSSDIDRRGTLARWISSPNNPLFSRVIVNRIWQYHFGTGIVDTPSDFGFNGSRPTHPDLLDFLCGQFIESGYSMKNLHRMIVLSRTYQQDSKPSDEALKIDFDNRMLWRWSPRRHDAEVLRDSTLKVCGTLNQEMHGAGFSDYKTESNNGTTYYTPLDKLDFTLSRHSIYRFTPRGANQGLLDSFDCPDNSSAAPKRSKTITPIQAMAFWNGEFTRIIAESYEKNHVGFSALGSTELKINHIYKNILQRHPSKNELKIATDLVQNHGLPPLIRVLINSNEFLTME